jgi:hypothetical protein
MRIAKLTSTLSLGLVLALGAMGHTYAASESKEKVCVDDSCLAEMRNLVQLARNGSGRAAGIVAMAYASGDGLELNLDRAERFIKMGARSRDPVATYLYADWLRTGFVVEQDLEESAKWLERSVEADYAPAKFEKAKLLFASDDPQQIERAVTLLEEAADTRLLSAMFLLARLQQTGTATEKNLENAGLLFKELTKSRYPQARGHLEEVVNELAGNQQGADKDELIANLNDVGDVEVIKVRGQSIDVGLILDGLVSRLNESGNFDSRAVGSRLNGVNCQQTGSNCGSADPKGSGASNISELLGGR